MSSRVTLDDLRQVIKNCPVIDNHAHNILRPEELRSHDFRTIATEANGAALDETITSLPHIRAARQLRSLYGLPTDADWSAITARRVELLDENAGRLFHRCFAGTETILIDDGLGNPEELETYSWHDQYTASPCKRIVRIESVAADLLSSLYEAGRLPADVQIADYETCLTAWSKFVATFEEMVSRYLQDPEVAGFKSVVCYRTGLDIAVNGPNEILADGFRSFQHDFLPTSKTKKFRVAHKGMNDALVHATCRVLSEHRVTHGKTKPLQFHTGLGDNDLALLKSNPAHLQPLIELFPSVQVVLLHSSYPYTREAGYLATHFDNVYLDIGEVFPMTSRDAQEQIVREALEITPTSRILWSTDGHHFPETYYLANLQGRQAIEKVMLEYVERDDLTIKQAISAVQDIFFNNSNRLYGLDLSWHSPGTATQHTSLSAQEHGETVVPIIDRSSTPLPNARNMVTLDTSIEMYLVQWIDYLGTLRMRCIPSRELHRLAVAGELKFSISRGNLGTLQNDGFTSEVEPVGHLLVHPDLTSLKKLTQRGHLKENAATIMSSFYTEEGKPHPMCPRRSLSAAVSTLKHEYKLAMKIGFEIECTFCRRTDVQGSFSPLDNNKAWSTFTDEQYINSYSLMFEVQRALADIGIHIQQFHSESGPGQYEFVLPPAHPITAIDTLYQARQCMQQVAANQGLRVTLHPSPFNGIGNASHTHMSLRSTSNTEDAEAQQMSFMAGVLEHLPAICAFTLPQAVSYSRVKDDSWSGGSWIAYGTQNREVPLRRIADVHGQTQRWELRCIDGLPNMYLAMLVVVKAGIAGLKQKMSMKSQDLTRNPTRISEAELEALGITRRMPKSLDESLSQLRQDTAFIEAVGEPLVKHYCAVKEAEQAMLMTMSESARRIWLIEKY